MNMNDLKALAAQKAAASQEFPDLPEDSPELKTPTAEDIMVPEQKVTFTYLVLLFYTHFWPISGYGWWV